LVYNITIKVFFLNIKNNHGVYFPMENSNRTTKKFHSLILAFILTASSIPNIFANTNPEMSLITPTSIVHTDTIDELTTTPSVTAASANEVVPQDPVTIHLHILATISDDLINSIDNGFLKLAKTDSLKLELTEAKSFAIQLLQDFKEKKPDLKMQMLCELIIISQIDVLTDLINGKKPTKPNLEDAINTLDTQDVTDTDLIALTNMTNQKFEFLATVIVKKSKSKLDRTSDLALNQLCAVDRILEELALYIRNDSLKVTKKDKTIESIIAIRALIESCKSDRSQITEQRIHNLLKLNAHLIEHVKTIIKNNFNDIPTLEIDPIFKSGPKEITLEELEHVYSDNEILFATLEKDAQSAGLTWYNHAARRMSSLCDYNALYNRMIAISAGLFTASVVAHQLGIMPKDMKDWKVWYTDKKLFGEPWGIFARGATPTPPNPEESGLIGDLVSFAGYAGTNPAIVLPASVAYAYGINDYRAISRWMSDRMTATSNFLLGTKPVKNTTEISRVEPKYNFDDVIGQQDIKEALSIIVRYFEDPRGIDNRGLNLAKRYLFTGKTRSGKSFMAEALAGEITKVLAAKGEKFNYLVVPVDLLLQPATPTQNSGFKICMDYARRHAPCLLFIDEIHLLNLQAGKNDALLSEVLTELGGVGNDPQSKVFLITATNHEDRLDKALRTSGRIDKEIRFEYPTFEDRTTFVTDILEKRSVNVGMIDIRRFARESEGCTFEDMRKVIEGAFIAAKVNGEALSQEHLDQSFDTNIRGILFNKGLEISDQERSIVAVHQAGYTLATKLLAPRESIAKVTTLPVHTAIKERAISDQYTNPNDSKVDDRKVDGRLFTYKLNNNESLQTAQEQINACTIALAGYAAGNTILGKANNSATYLAEKRQEAFEIAKKAVSNGIDIDTLDDKLKTEYYKRALAFRNACDKKAAQLMEKNKQALERIAGALFEDKTLTGRQIDAILAQCTLSAPTIDNEILNIMDDMSITLTT
jgi:ATP-dependent Zn protease